MKYCEENKVTIPIDDRRSREVDCIIQISDSNDVLLTTTHDRGSVIAHNGDNNYNNLICVATHCNDFAYCGKFNAHSLPAWRRACFIET